MAYTTVDNLNDALRALNCARDALNPARYNIFLDGHGRVQTSWCWFGGTSELVALGTVTWRAQQTVNRALGADAALRLVDAHAGRWVAIR